MAIDVQLHEQPLESRPNPDSLRSPDAGAVIWFEGRTRRRTGETITQTLFYEAYVPMALEQLRRLAQQAVERFELWGVVIHHRLGEVPIGEASVVVGCSSAHRKQALESVAWIMDTLKTEVPIWKRETTVSASDDADKTFWVHPVLEPGDGSDVSSGPDS